MSTPKVFVAIDLTGTPHEFSELGINEIKRLHEKQGVKGWAYGPIEDMETLKKKVNPMSELEAENARLKAELAAAKGGGEAPLLNGKTKTAVELIELIKAAKDDFEVDEILGGDVRKTVVEAATARKAELAAAK